MEIFLYIIGFISFILLFFYISGICFESDLKELEKSDPLYLKFLREKYKF